MVQAPGADRSLCRLLCERCQGFDVAAEFVRDAADFALDRLDRRDTTERDEREQDEVLDRGGPAPVGLETLEELRHGHVFLRCWFRARPSTKHSRCARSEAAVAAAR